MTNDPPGPLERVRGALLGLAVGDALGAPLEFMSANQIQIKHGTVDSMVGGGWLDLRPGDWLSDAGLALALAASLAERRAYDEGDVAGRYVAWAASRPQGLPDSIRASLAEIEAGSPPAEASARAAAGGAPSADTARVLGRTAPIGLALHTDRRALLAASAADARLTHPDPDAASAAAAVNLVLAAFLAGETDLPAIVEGVRGALEEGPGDLVDVIPFALDKTLEDLRPAEGAVDTLEVALVALGAGRTFQETLVGAVNLGGNTATIGALCGALAGCRHGAASIPRSWLGTLRDRARIDRAARNLVGG